jgi:N-acetylneuraminic acid mutarotase
MHYLQMKSVLYFFFILFFFTSCSKSDLIEGTPFAVEQKSVISDGGRASAVAFAIGEKGYVALGRNSSGALLNDCWQYDPALDTWTRTTDFPGKARVKAIAVTVNGSAYVGLGYCSEIGSSADSVAYLKDFWMYNANTNVWTRKADFPSRYSDGCVSFVYNNEIYVGDGYNGVGATKEFWKYNPVNNTWTLLHKFPGDFREIAVACAGEDHCYFGTGFQGSSYNDWWEFFPATDSWEKRESMPDHGRQNAVALCMNNRYVVATGRYWKGSVEANKYLRADMVEYDPEQNNWISRGEITGGRENAIAFSIDGKGYIGFGEDDNGMVNTFWCVHP